jgi:hypothetical protein
MIYGVIRTLNIQNVRVALAESLMDVTPALPADQASGTLLPLIMQVGSITLGQTGFTCYVKGFSVSARRGARGPIKGIGSSSQGSGRPGPSCIGPDDLTSHRSGKFDFDD